MLDDTISAICTAPGEGAIGIIRISGPKSTEIAEKMFLAKNNKSIRLFPANKLVYGKVRDPQGAMIDEALCVYMKAPHSYTAEDVVELQCHGSRAALAETLQLTWRHGARPAHAGEFTQRAFLNGRIDLAQAEAVMGIIRAKSDAALKQALYQQQGLFSQEIKNIRSRLKDILVETEAVIDYPEEDLEDVTADNIVVVVEKVLSQIEDLVAKEKIGRIIKEGLRTVITGKPNVGKSSLLNALLGQERAIVTDIAGTTRDSIEEEVFVEGLPLILIDTAGIRDTEDIIEKIGVEKSRGLLEEADLCLLLLDASNTLDEDDKDLLHAIRERPHIVLLNKQDVAAYIMKENIIQLGYDEKDIIEISVLTKAGWTDFANRLKEKAYGESGSLGEGFYVQEARHSDLLHKAKEGLMDALQAARAKMPLDCILIDIKHAFNNLGYITGETVNDELLKEIFARFCLGK